MATGGEGEMIKTVDVGSPPPAGASGGGGDGDVDDRRQHENLENIAPIVAKDAFAFHCKRKNVYSTEPLPLGNPWTFWVDRSERGVKLEEFEANLKRIYMVYTIQRFWAVYYNIPPPCDLQTRSSLHMMRDDRKPLWEEEYNCKGGTFRFRVQKKDSQKVWKELLMAAIGDQLNDFLHEKDEICGVSISARDNEDVLLIWNKDAELARDSRVLECVHQLLPDTTFLSTFYKPHVAHMAFEKSSIKGPLPYAKRFKLPCPVPEKMSIHLNNRFSGGDH